MALTFELAHFVVRDGEEQALLAERPGMIRALREAFPDALAAWLTRQDDNSWLDVILWRSRDAAEEAAQQMHGVPEARHSPTRRRPVTTNTTSAVILRELHVPGRPLVLPNASAVPGLTQAM